MKNQSKEKRICSFYVSEWHLVAMLLPYLNEQINQGKEVFTLLENDLKDNVEEILNKMNLKEDTKTKIRNINWSSNKVFNIENFKNQLIKENIKDRDVVLIVTGKNEDVQENNVKISKFLENNKYKTITIINCFEVLEFNKRIDEILDEHDKILNTSGEREINEIFDGYERRDVNLNIVNK